MADQGKVVIRRAIPASTARGLLLSGAGTLSATLRAIGVVYEGTDATETAGQVQISGTALVTSSGTIAAGKLCASDANGKLVAVSAGSEHLGMAVTLEASSAGELVSCKLI